MEDIRYIPTDRSTLRSNHQYTHVPYPILCNNGNDPVTYIDLLDFGTIKQFGITDNETGLNPNIDITTWESFVKSIDKHIRALNARIQSLENTVSMISIVPSGDQDWFDETQDTFTANTNVNWMLSNTTDFGRTPASGQSTTIRYIGNASSSGTLEISTDKSSYTVGETATITITFISGSSTFKSTTVTASSQISNTSKSFTITKHIEAASLTSVTCTKPDGSTENKAIRGTSTRVSAVFQYTFNTSGSQTFTASGDGVTSVSTTVTVSAGETPLPSLYWYVGVVTPTDPNNTAENTGNNKWTELTATPLGSISVNTDMQMPPEVWYIAIPHSYNFQAYDSTGASPDSAAYTKSQVTIAGTQYDLFTGTGRAPKVNAVFKQ